MEYKMKMILSGECLCQNSKEVVLIYVVESYVCSYVHDIIMSAIHDIKCNLCQQIVIENFISLVISFTI